MYADHITGLESCFSKPRRKLSNGALRLTMRVESLGVYRVDVDWLVAGDRGIVKVPDGRWSVDAYNLWYVMLSIP